MEAANDGRERSARPGSGYGQLLGRHRTFDTFDTSDCEVSPPNPLENCGSGHSRHFRHQRSEQIATRQPSAHVHRQDTREQASASRVVSNSVGVECVESVENVRTESKHSDLVFDTSSSQVSKNGGRVSKTGRSAASKAPLAGISIRSSVSSAAICPPTSARPSLPTGSCAAI
jgi:hypothetical protein